MSILETVLAGTSMASLAYLAVHAGRPLYGALTLGGRREDTPESEWALAASRLSVPVSIVVPISGRAGLDDVRSSLLGLSYPEFEVIFVGSTDDAAASDLDAQWNLQPMEFFYRRSLQSAPVTRILRGSRDERLAVVELEARASLSDRLNAGVNMARYRFVAVVPPHVRFDADALLRLLQPALQDPKAIASVFSHVEDDGVGTARSRAARIQRLDSIRAQLSSRLFPTDVARSIGAHGSVTVWRKDALVSAGGFANVGDPQLDLARRIPRETGRVVCTPQPFGWASTPAQSNVIGVTEKQHFAHRVDWPVLAGVAVLLASVATGAATGVMRLTSALAVMPLLAFGAALVNVAALLVKGGVQRAPRSQELRSLLLVSPLEPLARASSIIPFR